MSASTRPQFWLQIRKEYIIDNFDNLLNYLIHYDYDINEENNDYDATIECIRQLTEEFRTIINDTPLYENVTFPYDKSLVIRLLCADILATYKTGKTSHTAILALVEWFTKSDIRLELQQIYSLYNICVKCMQKAAMSFTGFGWSDIQNHDVKGEILIYKLCKMAFKGIPKDENHIYDGKGFILIKPTGEIDLSLVNLSLYTQRKYERLYELPDMLRVLAETDNYESSPDFNRYYNTTVRLIKAQQNYKGSSHITRNTYSNDDCFPVRIISKQGWRMEAETIHPGYEKIRGKILLQLPQRRPHAVLFKDMLEVGDIIMVYRCVTSSEYAFDTYDSFEDFYRKTACSYHANFRQAIFLNDIPIGSEWITCDGIRVAIHKSKYYALSDEEKELFQVAKEQRHPITLRFYNDAPDIDSEDFNVYAEPYNHGFDPLHDEMFSEADAEENMLSMFIEHSINEGERIEGEYLGSFVDMDPKDVSVFIPLIYCMGKIDGRSSRSKLEHFATSAIISNLCGHDSDLHYLEHECAYLNAEVQFASDKEFRTLDHDSSLDGVDVVLKREKIIGTLLSYRKKNPVSTNAMIRLQPQTDTLDKVTALVNASNSLIDIIDDMELNNIKQAIAKTLGVEDEFASILDDRTYYGVESINLEFKSSVVYPPLNQRRMPSQDIDPERQKWAILKAVCGFLNSRSGGDLLIGVNDAGYAIGLEDDMRTLHKLKYISSPDEDHYRLYIMKLMYQAFTEISSNKPNTDIANAYIDCYHEVNAEGRSVMRVKVLPYQRQLVKFAASAEDRPEGIEESYVRKSGRTMPISEGMREEIMKYKN